MRITGASLTWGNTASFKSVDSLPSGASNIANMPLGVSNIADLPSGASKITDFPSGASNIVYLFSGASDIADLPLGSKKCCSLKTSLSYMNEENKVCARKLIFDSYHQGDDGLFHFQEEVRASAILLQC